MEFAWIIVVDIIFNIAYITYYSHHSLHRKYFPCFTGKKIDSQGKLSLQVVPLVNGKTVLIQVCLIRKLVSSSPMIGLLCYSPSIIPVPIFKVLTKLKGRIFYMCKNVCNIYFWNDGPPNIYSSIKATKTLTKSVKINLFKL